jgi:predicted dehydrogenase
MGLTRVAFVGAGVTARAHARAFAACGAELAGVASRTRASAESFAAEFGVGVVADTPGELWARTSAQLVVLCVSDAAIHAAAAATLPLPWAVLMEKPLGLGLAEAESIARVAAARPDRRVAVGLNRRALAATRTVLADVERTPGTRFVRVEDQQSVADRLAAGDEPRLAANQMYANSIHLIDYFPVFCRGAPRRVNRVVPWNPAAPGPVVAAIEYESGDIGLYEAHWDRPGPWTCLVATPARRWELRPLETATRQDAGTRARVEIPGDPKDAEFKPGFHAQARAALAMARGEGAPFATLDDAMATTRLISEIYAS